MSDLSSRLAFRRELPRHLSELEQLTGRRVNSSELLSIEETERIRKQTMQFQSAPSSQWAMTFEEKETPRFREFVAKLIELNPADVYIWTPATNACGLLRPIPLVEVNFAFPFSLNPEGILTFLTLDLCDRLLLDYFIETNGRRSLELEASGKSWGDVPY